MFLTDFILKLLNFIIRAVYESFQSVFRRVSSLMTLAPTHLVEEYESKYGSVHPKIFIGGFDEAKRIALNTQKMIVLYIHSDQNDNVCREMFTNQLVIEILDSNFIFYVEYYKGARMRKLMALTNAMMLPHISVLAFRTQTRCTIVNRLDENIDYDSLVTMLLSSVEYQLPPEPSLETSRKVIQEQNEEYRKAVEIDSVKFKERDIKRRDEAKKRRTQELMKQEKKEKKEKITENRKEMANKYKEVERGGDTKIRVRLPNGNSIETTFSKSDKVQKIYEWVEASEFLYNRNKNIRIPYNFNLSIPYPNTLLSDKTVTLESANLVPNASLLLTSLDDTSDEES